MSGGVDAPRQATKDRQSRVGKLVGKLLGGFQPVEAGLPRADDADALFVGGGQLAPDVEHDGWIVNGAQKRGVTRRFGG